MTAELEVVRPRWSTPRDPSRPTWGPTLGTVSSLLGFEQFQWQRDAGDVALEHMANPTNPAQRIPVYRLVGIAVARQNGKTTLVVSRIALELVIPGTLVVYTAQDRQLARFKWAEHVELLLDSPFRDRVRDVVWTNGREVLVMENGSRYLIVTPGERAGRSLTADLVVIDEAFAQEDMTLVGAMQPTMIARPRAQMWLLSNAGTGKSKLWRHYTDVGRALSTSTDPVEGRMCWIEYAAGDGAAVNDPRALREANPTLDLPGGVSSIALLDAAATMDEATFRREHLNQWTDQAATAGIDPVAWAACERGDVSVGDELALGLDVAPGRDRGSLVVAGPVDELVALEVIAHGSDIAYLVRRTIEVAQRWNVAVAVDRRSAAGSAIRALERAGVEVREVTLPDLVAACGDIHDAILDGLVAHRDDYRLNDAVAAATRRRVADAWAWQRRGSGDISALVAATIARWSVLNAEPDPVPAIY